MRRGGCYAECNRRGSVLDVVHELHQAQFHAFLELCRTEPATHHALHLAKVLKLFTRTREIVDRQSSVLLPHYGGACGGGVVSEHIKATPRICRIQQ